MQLAERAELSLDSIKRVENGKITLSLDNFLRLADALDVSLSYLIYSSMEIILETERVLYVLQGKNKTEKEYLLHILQEMAKELSKLF